MNYSGIKETDIANGTGVRVSLFVSGCRHHCKGCFNPDTWRFEAGEPFTQETEALLLKTLEPDYVNGLSLLGGEPMEPDNQRALVPFLKKVREKFPQKTVWCYTGCVLQDDFTLDGDYTCEVTEELLSAIDVLVDGRFIEEKKNLRLLFRGSENQRLINMQASRKQGKPVLLDL